MNAQHDVRGGLRVDDVRHGGIRDGVRVDGRQPADAPPAARTGNGPPRGEAARDAVLRAADNPLADTGFPAMTIGTVAERAGVAKQTVSAPSA
ncbi:hypothetical protein [Streptomyces sp. NPDC059894]|uniref:hypothetical protein n=1 Tax=unclassified Streptomyces TaxID=2593676 RepID=UPI00366104E3